jgi:hypothetical protein
MEMHISRNGRDSWIDHPTGAGLEASIVQIHEKVGQSMGTTIRSQEFNT